MITFYKESKFYFGGGGWGAGVSDFFLERIKSKIYIYIYIYRERERERERDNKSTMPENAEKYFYGPTGIRTHDLGNTA